jgi:replicative superfamily II helicase
VTTVPRQNPLIRLALHCTQILNASHNVVVSAPTGCGKTAVMELAIVALLKRLDYHPGGSSHEIKIVYSEIGAELRRK